MLYPFAKNDEQLRTHDDFLQAAQAAAAKHNHTGRKTIIDGVRGFSPLLCIIKYPVSVLLLHAPENEAEIDLAEKLLRFYCESSSLIYDPSVELYSLHCHLHLAEQVRYHGGLSYSSAFAFESCIRYTKKKAHGTRNLASQISYWTDIALLIKQPKFDVEIPHGVDEISIGSPQLEEFREMLTDFIQFDKVKFYKRFKIPFITFHSKLYDNKFKCVSHIISYKHDQDDKIRFGDCIIFIQWNNDYYAFINNYRDEAPNNSLSSLLKISDTATCQIIEPLDRLYSIKSKSDSFEILSMSKVRHKCISVPVGDFFCLTEIRNDFEHD
ncbi:unnamed protein product [Rotaria sp. Silwood1]|nr:unnamed protein product [Rotaria sp. Silwood1]CAF4867968.1 unnamed protein product [Rotaria sp. Silwood1]CAF4931349.1 unnamed protein product [Rotaria sp. Silwood1]CAF4940958.1 unnamed protein product [Rotaria sp. Silwood1]